MHPFHSTTTQRRLENEKKDFYPHGVFYGCSNHDGRSSTRVVASEKTLKIGALMAVTGWWASAYDNTILHMSEIAAEIINEQGGIKVKGDTYKIKLVVEDTKSDFNGVASAANKLIYDRGVKFIIGPSGFFVSAATPVTEPQK